MDLNMNIFVYYGAELNKHDYENLVDKFDIKDLYNKVYGMGLNFKEVGHIPSSWKYIIGKEIYWSRDNLIDINQFNDKFIVEGTDIKLKLEDESEIRKKLLQIGITNIPTYKIFNCWN
jgi:hypothetical protein